MIPTCHVLFAAHRPRRRGGDACPDRRACRHKSENQVLELMGGRLAHVRSSPASAPLADDAAFLLRQILHKDGYTDAAVDWKISWRNEIVLIVNEGGRRSLGKVNGHRRARGRREEIRETLCQAGGEGPPARRRIAAIPRGGCGDRPVVSEAGIQRPRLLVGGGGRRGARHRSRHGRGRSNHRGETRARLSDRAAHRDQRRWLWRRRSRRPRCSPSSDERPRRRTSMRCALAVEEIAVSRGYPDAKIRMTQTLQAGEFIPGFSIELGTRVRLRQHPHRRPAAHESRAHRPAHGSHGRRVV